ncbi:MAG: hypothetical protein ACUVQF_00280 [Fervidobacterium sp.]|uniref:hypothetical protein n=1 Tax=Fervidobacterium sp. TaxID=1871331 RepID=UPI004049D4F0
MKFFYNLEKVENYEYVVVKVQESEHTGVGAILPIRRNGENYKIFMGAIEEYRTIVEKSKAEDVFIIPKILEKHFPKHPKVTFAIQAAFLELFCKKYKIELEKLLGGLQSPKNEICGDLLYPEYFGDIFYVRYVPEIEAHINHTFVLVKYPHNEMDHILSALSTNYKNLEVISWKELL